MDDFLIKCGLKDAVETFAKHRMELSQVVELNENELIELLPNVGDRLRFKKAVREMVEDETPPPVKRKRTLGSSRIDEDEKSSMERKQMLIPSCPSMVQFLKSNKAMAQSLCEKTNQIFETFDSERFKTCVASPGWQSIDPIDGKIVCPFCRGKIAPQLRKDRPNLEWNLGNVSRHLIDYCGSADEMTKIQVNSMLEVIINDEVMDSDHQLHKIPVVKLTRVGNPHGAYGLDKVDPGELVDKEPQLQTSETVTTEVQDQNRDAGLGAVDDETSNRSNLNDAVVATDQSSEHSDRADSNLDADQGSNLFELTLPNGTDQPAASSIGFERDEQNEGRTTTETMKSESIVSKEIELQVVGASDGRQLDESATKSHTGHEATDISVIFEIKTNEPVVISSIEQVERNCRRKTAELTDSTSLVSKEIEQQTFATMAGFHLNEFVSRDQNDGLGTGTAGSLEGKSIASTSQSRHETTDIFNVIKSDKLTSSAQKNSETITETEPIANNNTETTERDIISKIGICISSCKSLPTEAIESTETESNNTVNTSTLKSRPARKTSIPKKFCSKKNTISVRKRHSTARKGRYSTRSFRPSTCPPDENFVWVKMKYYPAVPAFIIDNYYVQTITSEGELSQAKYDDFEILNGKFLKPPHFVQELRYSLSLQENKRGSQLPPTLGTLIPHIKRSFYMSLIWKTTIQSSPEVISPSDYGWYLDETGEYHPVRCDKPSAPDALLNLKHCGCKATVERCKTARCKCQKNGLPCTDLCKCGDQCKNQENECDKEPTLNDEDDLDNF